jgi:hypothetical protein
MSWHRVPLWDLRPDIVSCRNVAVWNLRSCIWRTPSLTRGRTSLNQESFEWWLFHHLHSSTNNSHIFFARLLQLLYSHLRLVILFLLALPKHVTHMIGKIIFLIFQYRFSHKYTLTWCKFNVTRCMLWARFSLWNRRSFLCRLSFMWLSLKTKFVLLSICTLGHYFQHVSNGIYKQRGAQYNVLYSKILAWRPLQ